MTSTINNYLFDSVLFFQIISTRDKVTGKYLPMLDGNLNVTLNRIYAKQHDLSDVTITMPSIDLLNIEQFNELEEFCKNTFSVPITFVHLDCYGLNVEITRKNILENKHNVICQLQTHIDIADTIISDFPIKLDVVFIEQSHKDFVYNYNWSYCSDNETNETLIKFFELEKKLAETYATYLYSDIQYDYWIKNINHINLHVYRSTEIFVKEYLQLVSKYHVDKYIATIDSEKRNELDELISNNNIVFYPSRIEDPRYQFKNVIDLAQNGKAILIVSNPTNYKLVDILYSHFLEAHIHDNVRLYDMSDEIDKRSAYFYILSKLKPTDKIYRFEHDMHISYVEQSLLTKAEIIAPNFTQEQLSSYIYQHD